MSAFEGYVLRANLARSNVYLTMVVLIAFMAACSNNSISHTGNTDNNSENSYHKDLEWSISSYIYFIIARFYNLNVHFSGFQ